MRLFKLKNNELRLGWKILRVYIVVAALVLSFAALASLIQFKPLEDYAVHLAMIIGTLLGLIWEHKQLSYIGIRLREKAFWADSLFGFFWGCLSIVLVVAGMALISGEMHMSQLVEGFSVPGLVYSLIFWFAVAVGEELLFRGYTFSILRQRMNMWIALVISACIFSAIHIINSDYYWFAYVYAILIGVIFGGILIKRGNLGCAIGFHYAWNLLQDKGVLNVPARGGEAIFSVVLIIMAIIVFLVLPRRSTEYGHSDGIVPNITNT